MSARSAVLGAVEDLALSPAVRLNHGKDGEGAVVVA
jgi:hypothetical protein